MRATGLTFVALIAAGIMSDSALGQGQDPFGFGQPEKYRRPSINAYQNALNNDSVSPYLNLTRRANQQFGMPQYQAFVEPRLEQQRADMATQRSLQLQQQTTGGTYAERLNSLHGAAPTMRSTGGRSQFMNYLHYYPAGPRR